MRSTKVLVFGEEVGSSNVEVDDVASRLLNGLLVGIGEELDCHGMSIGLDEKWQSVVRSKVGFMWVKNRSGYCSCVLRKRKWMGQESSVEVFEVEVSEAVIFQFRKVHGTGKKGAWK